MVVEVSGLFQRSFPDADAGWSIPGIDVSGNQPDTIIADLHNAGVWFDWAIIKASEGTSYQSSEAFQQVADARLYGKAVGMYHWLSYRTSPQLEFANLAPMLEQLAVHQPNGPLPAAVWLDAEDTNYDRHVVDSYGYGDYTAELAALITRNFGCPVGIYSAAWWADGRLAAECSHMPLWVADYDDQRVWPGYRTPNVPAAWADQQPALWQWTSLTDEIGSLDLNMAYSADKPDIATATNLTGAPMSVTIIPATQRPGGFDGKDVWEIIMSGPARMGSTVIDPAVCIMPIHPDHAIEPGITVDIHCNGPDGTVVANVQVKPSVTFWQPPFTGRISVVVDPSTPIAVHGREVYYI